VRRERTPSVAHPHTSRFAYSRSRSLTRPSASPPPLSHLPAVSAFPAAASSSPLMRTCAPATASPPCTPRRCSARSVARCRCRWRRVGPPHARCWARARARFPRSRPCTRTRCLLPSCLRPASARPNGARSCRGSSCGGTSSRRSSCHGATRATARAASASRPAASATATAAAAVSQRRTRARAWSWFRRGPRSPGRSRRRVGERARAREVLKGGQRGERERKRERERER
jgi:hypothetical protein